jgi:hypothetical protein
VVCTLAAVAAGEIAFHHRPERLEGMPADLFDLHDRSDGQLALKGWRDSLMRYAQDHDHEEGGDGQPGPAQA